MEGIKATLIYNYMSNRSLFPSTMTFYYILRGYIDGRECGISLRGEGD
jgi:hypothetical protein